MKMWVLDQLRQGVDSVEERKLFDTQSLATVLAT